MRTRLGFELGRIVTEMSTKWPTRLPIWIWQWTRESGRENMPSLGNGAWHCHPHPACRTDATPSASFHGEYAFLLMQFAFESSLMVRLRISRSLSLQHQTPHFRIEQECVAKCRKLPSVCGAKLSLDLLASTLDALIMAWRSEWPTRSRNRQGWIPSTCINSCCALSLIKPSTHQPSLHNSRVWDYGRCVFK